tara:strand:- start:83 stop:1846 length:1764 start_codon:yes stop_codon:yes gene_type:complete
MSDLEPLQSSTLSPTALFVVIAAFVGLVPFTALLVYKYADRRTPIAYLLFVFVGWYSGFAGTLLLPIDIANTLATGASATAESPLTFVWKVVGYITMLFAWVITPFVMEFRVAGGFTWCSKMKQSLKTNCTSYVVLIGIVAACVVLIVVLRLSYKTLSPMLTAVGNIYGLTFIVVLMSYGLVEIPRTLWSVCKGPSVLLKRLQFEAPTREAELFDAITEFSSALRRVRVLEKALRDDAPPAGSAALDHGLHTILAVGNATLAEISLSSQWSSTIHIDTRGDGDDAPWEMDGSTVVTISTKLKRMEEVHARIKTAGQRVRVAIEMWKRLLLNAKRMQSLVDEDGKPKTRRGLGHLWREYLGPITGKVLSVFFALMSIAILWCEVSIGSFAVPLSPFGRVLSIIPSGESSQVAVQAFAFVPLAYMTVCTYRSLLLVRLPFIRSFDIYSGRLTDAYALMKNAAYLCRLQFTLGVNYLSVLNMGPTWRWALGAHQTSFQLVVGRMDSVGVLRGWLGIYRIVPAVCIIVVLLVVCKIYGRILLCLGGAEMKIEPDPKNEEDRERIEEGRRLISVGLRDLGGSNAGESGVEMT